MKRTHVVGVALALALSMTAPVAAMAAEHPASAVELQEVAATQKSKFAWENTERSGSRLTSAKQGSLLSSCCGSHAADPFPDARITFFPDVCGARCISSSPPLCSASLPDTTSKSRLSGK